MPSLVLGLSLCPPINVNAAAVAVAERCPPMAGHARHDRKRRGLTPRAQNARHPAVSPGEPSAGPSIAFFAQRG